MWLIILILLIVYLSYKSTFKNVLLPYDEIDYPIQNIIKNLPPVECKNTDGRIYPTGHLPASSLFNIKE